MKRISVAKVFEMLEKDGLDASLVTIYDLRYLLSMAIDLISEVDENIIQTSYGYRGLEVVRQYSEKLGLDGEKN